MSTIQKILEDRAKLKELQKAKDLHDFFWGLMVAVNLIMWGILCSFKITRFFTVGQGIGIECFLILGLIVLVYLITEAIHTPKKDKS